LISSWLTISQTLLCSSCAWVVYKKWMRELYAIDRFWLVTTISIGFLCFLVVFLQLGT
jgi:hypothetical protein